jgi:hypothetical protein
VNSHNPARAASLVAALGLLVMAILGVFGNFVALQSLVVPGDAAATARALAGSDGLFRWGIVSLVLAAVLDVIVAAALHSLFGPVNRGVSTLAAWFRVAYAGMFLLAISQLVGVLAPSTAADRVLERITAFEDIWHVGLILFGVHLLVIGYLVHRSAASPVLVSGAAFRIASRTVGILLLIAGSGYLADGFGAILVSDYSGSIAQFTFVGEVVFIVWLVAKGRSVVAEDVASAATAVSHDSFARVS